MSPAATKPLSATPDPTFTFAFQPIVDTKTRLAFSHEALVRGVNNESAFEVLNRYSGAAMTEFDGACRARAIEVASLIGVDTHLNLNLLPSAAFDERSGVDSTITA